MTLLNEPAAQLTQAAALVELLLLLNLPTAQPVQNSEPAVDQDPAAQTRQTAALLPPVALFEVPAAQSMHEGEPVPVHWPTGQVSHS